MCQNTKIAFNGRPWIFHRQLVRAYLRLELRCLLLLTRRFGLLLLGLLRWWRGNRELDVHHWGSVRVVAFIGPVHFAQYLCTGQDAIPFSCDQSHETQLAAMSMQVAWVEEASGW